ncbi:hypothetical protein LshimejAT787_0109380 [Lyophyllum shimeji]|uniref:Uncharacterized protein n=1 Tax=Lyophyllum shimeji TaxID=47721 RepID=A0A9P3PEE2_LYOSH|nr:hypothetical protein LshimejAT787_0109380 [Lyophyllum shimeji]
MEQQRSTCPPYRGNIRFYGSAFNMTYGDRDIVGRAQNITRIGYFTAVFGIHMIPVDLRILATTATVKRSAQRIHHSEAAGGNPTSRSRSASQSVRSTPGAQRHNPSLSHGRDLSQPRTVHRSARSSSARTAFDSDIQKWSRTHAPRKPSIVLLAPLSKR